MLNIEPVPMSAWPSMFGPGNDGPPGPVPPLPSRRSSRSSSISSSYHGNFTTSKGKAITQKHKATTDADEASAGGKMSLASRLGAILSGKEKTGNGDNERERSYGKDINIEMSTRVFENACFSVSSSDDDVDSVEDNRSSLEEWRHRKMVRAMEDFATAATATATDTSDSCPPDPPIPVKFHRAPAAAARPPHLRPPPAETRPAAPVVPAPVTPTRPSPIPVRLHLDRTTGPSSSAPASFLAAGGDEIQRQQARSAPATPVAAGNTSRRPVELRRFHSALGTSTSTSTSPNPGPTSNKKTIVVGSSGKSTRRPSVVPFPVKLHDMLTEMDKDVTGNKGKIVSWMPHGRCLKVHKPQEFVKKILPKYFRQTKLTSFQRQLNVYGFTRIVHGKDRGAYYNRYFLRGKRVLSYMIARESIKGTGVRTTTLIFPEQEPDFYGMGPVEQDRGRTYCRCKGNGDDNADRLGLRNALCAKAAAAMVTPTATTRAETTTTSNIPASVLRPPAPPLFPLPIWSSSTPPSPTPKNVDEAKPGAEAAPQKTSLRWPAFDRADVLPPDPVPSSSGPEITMVATTPEDETAMNCCRWASRCISEDGIDAGSPPSPSGGDIKFEGSATDLERISRHDGGHSSKYNEESNPGFVDPWRDDDDDREREEREEHETGDRVQFEGMFFHYLHRFDDNTAAEASSGQATGGGNGIKAGSSSAAAAMVRSISRDEFSAASNARRRESREKSTAGGRGEEEGEGEEAMTAEGPPEEQLRWVCRRGKSLAVIMGRVRSKEEEEEEEEEEQE